MIDNLRRRCSKLRAGTAALNLTVALVLGALATPLAQPQTFTAIYSFTGSTDGGNPQASLIKDESGTFYGTTATGGSGNCTGRNGCGVVFKVDTAGTETVLHSFRGAPTDGEGSTAPLLRDSKGNLYGTTMSGGNGNCTAFGTGCGVVFMIDTAGTETVLYSFAGGMTDGCYPTQGLVEDKYGSLYGTTYECGGNFSACIDGCGTVFRLRPRKHGKWTETVLHSFAKGSMDGAWALYGHLLIDAKGTLYGLAGNGGTSDDGVLYKLTNKGKLTVLSSFTSAGCQPLGTLATDKAGNFYGTTLSCGPHLYYGAVWKVTKKGTPTVLHYSAGPPSDGFEPEAGVVFDSKGNMYGSTWAGGAHNSGTLWELSKKGMYSVLHSFEYNEGGGAPLGEFLRAANGVLYGTASNGGTGRYGTMWSYTP